MASSTESLTKRSSWVSLGTLVGLLLVSWLVWGSLLLVWFRVPIDWQRLDLLPRAMQDAYTLGVYLSIPAALYWFWKIFEERSGSELNLRFQLQSWLMGMGLGLAGLVSIYGISYGAGWIQFVPPHPWPWAATFQNIGAAILMGLVEELLFRGVILQTFLKDMSPRKAILWSALLYAFAHFMRPEFSLEIALRFTGLVTTGIVFGYAAWSRRTLWLSIGMHMIWIFFIALSSQYNLWAYFPSGFVWTGRGYPPGGVLFWVVNGLCLLSLWATRKKSW